MLDEHVAHAVAQARRRRDIEAQTAGVAGLLGAPDEAYLVYGLSTNRVPVTHDPDFLRLHQQHRAHAGIVYSEQRARSVGELIAHLVLMVEVMEPTEMIGRVEFP